MEDLFDGYDATPGAFAFDEMFDFSQAEPLKSPRSQYRRLHRALARMSQDELRGRAEALANSYLAQGVTFDFAGEERPFPLDALPRVIEHEEWTRIERGVQQRVRALEAFLDDAYGHQHCVRDGVLPAALIASSQYFYRQAAGIRSANGVRIQVSGIDLIRDERGEMRVLEDNVRVPSGSELRDLEPQGDGADPARALRLDARAPRRRLPRPPAASAAGLGARGHLRPDRRGAHPRASSTPPTSSTRCSPG
ncbi:MAG: circularly permuted type 2 ATP-grasp protein [Luteolibacter sp.]